jgi:hypothetical protein
MCVHGFALVIRYGRLGYWFIMVGTLILVLIQ